MTQMLFVQFDDTSVIAEPRAAARAASSGSIAMRRGPQIRAAAASRYQALLGLASTNLGVPVGEPDGRKRRRLGRRQVGQLRRSSSAASCSTSRCRATRSAAGSHRRSRSSQYTLVGHPVPRIDIPGEGDRHLHLRPERARAGDAARPGRAAARAGRLSGRARRCSRSTRARSSSIPGAQIVQRGELPRRRRAARVRRDPGGRAAEGRPGRTPPIARRAHGNLFEQMRGLDAAGLTTSTGLPRPPATSTPALRLGGPRRRVRYTYAYQGHMPIGPSCCVADVTANGRDRSTATRRTSTDPVAGSSTITGSRLARSGSSTTRARARSATAAYARRRRGGGGHVAARRRAGAAAVHALGRARLGQLRPGGAWPTPGGRRRERQHRRLLVHGFVGQPARAVASTTQRARPAPRFRLPASAPAATNDGDPRTTSRTAS